MKKQLLKVVCLLLSVSLLCSCGAPEDESTLSSVPETAGQTESSVDEATSSQGASIAETEVVPEVTKKPETEENSVAETTTEKTETTITTTKPTETESTPKPETTIPITTTKKPETSATPKPETTTATTTKKPETTATPKPETTTSTTTTKASETTTIATEKPDVAPTGHCEGFDKLWGMTIPEIKEKIDTDKLLDYYDCRIYEGTNNLNLLHYDAYYKNNFSVYGINFQSIIFCGDLENGEKCCEIDLISCERFMDSEQFDSIEKAADILIELYGNPNDTIINGNLIIHKWYNTKDGNITLTNDDDDSGIEPGTKIYISDPNRKLAS